jgi:hypothetical protein
VIRLGIRQQLQYLSAWLSGRRRNLSHIENMLAVLEDQTELLSCKELEKLEIINGKAPLRIRKVNDQNRSNEWEPVRLRYSSGAVFIVSFLLGEKLAEIRNKTEFLKL